MELNTSVKKFAVKESAVYVRFHDSETPNASSQSAAVSGFWRDVTIYIK